jgi:tetratricopeptide (TPR) repeat protein
VWTRRKPQTSAWPVGIGPIAARWIIALSAAATIHGTITTAQAAEPCDPGVARIVSLQGRVEVQRGEAGAWTAAMLDERLCIDDAIRVGAYARAALALANESVLNVDQLTTMRLAGEPETGRSLLDLLLGEVHFFSHRPRALEIDTPIASAGTEGTEFLMRARADRTEVLMFEGRVRLRTPEGELLLASGDAAVATPGAAPRPEIIARPRDAVTWTLYYPPILAPLAEHRAAPSTLPPGVQTAIERVAANDYGGAIAALDAVPEAARDARYYTYRAGVLLNVGRADEAAQAIDRALALNPDAADALAERAVIEVVQNRRDAALADARRAVELSPDSAPARIALSYAQQARFDLEAARATLREAAKRTPDNALVLARLAEIELSFGDLDAAQATAERAVALAPELARTQMVLGFAALTRIDLAAAKTAFEHAIRLDSAEPLARLGLGLAKIRAGDLEGGRRELEIAVALDPNNSLLRSYLGKAYFEERRDPQDGQQYEIAKKLDPNDPTPWFYDAIRLQTINQPVAALHNIEKSIELNDNRAVYRSRLLLDEDIAVRETSLARIYNTLGFEQVAVNEATKSLNADPANYSAHRFLSDTYAALPRHEIARASELLQSQLLQPLNINPVQPSLPLTDFNVITGAGPSQAAFNEFTPLFARQNTQLTTTGIVGNNDTYGGEGVLTMLYDRTSLSVGGSGFNTDGFRANNDDSTGLADAYAQVAVTPKLNLQAEYRYRNTDQGDLLLNFDPNDFSRDSRRNIDQNTGRIGLHYAPAPSSDVLASVFYSDRRDQTTVDSLDGKVDDKGYQAETEYLFRTDNANLVAGGGLYNIDADRRITVSTLVFNDENFKRQQQKGFLYGNLELPTKFYWTAGVSVDHFEEGDYDRNEVNPKVGLRWLLTDWFQVRLAYFETLKPALVVQQTIEPTQVAGFNQFLDDINGAEATTYAGGLDVRILSNLYGGAEYEHRDINFPSTTTNFGGATTTTTFSYKEDSYGAYLDWIPHEQWAVNLNVLYETFDAGHPDDPEVDTITVPVTLRYFNPNGLFADLGVSYVHQDVDRPPGSTQNAGKEDVALLDAAVGYRLPKRYGIISLEGRNLLDQKFDYQDLNYLTSENHASPLLPERTILARFTLSF